MIELTTEDIEWFHDGAICNKVLIHKKRGRPPMTEQFWYDPDGNDVIVLGTRKGEWLGEFKEDI